MELSQVKDEIVRGKKIYEAFKCADEIVDLVMGLDQRKKELAKSVEKLSAENAALMEGNSKAEAAMKHAKDEAKRLVSEAQAEVKVLIADAKAKATSEVDGANEKIKSMQADIELYTSMLAQIKGEADKAQSDLDAMQKKKAAALAKIAKEFE